MNNCMPLFRRLLVEARIHFNLGNREASSNDTSLSLSCVASTGERVRGSTQNFLTRLCHFLKPNRDGSAFEVRGYDKKNSCLSEAVGSKHRDGLVGHLFGRLPSPRVSDHTAFLCRVLPLRLPDLVVKPNETAFQHQGATEPAFHQTGSRHVRRFLDDHKAELESFLWLSSESAAFELLPGGWEGRGGRAQ